MTEPKGSAGEHGTNSRAAIVVWDEDARVDECIQTSAASGRGRELVLIPPHQVWAGIPIGRRGLAIALYGLDAAEALIPSLVLALLDEGYESVLLVRPERRGAVADLLSLARGAPESVTAFCFEVSGDRRSGESQGAELASASFYLPASARADVGEWEKWSLGRAGMKVGRPGSSVGSWWDRHVGVGSISVVRSGLPAAVDVPPRPPCLPHEDDLAQVRAFGPFLRSALREQLRQGTYNCEVLPTEISGLESFLTQPANSGLVPGLPLVVWSLWAARPDLQQAFPDAMASQQDELMDWAITQGVAEASLPADWLLRCAALPTSRGRRFRRIRRPRRVAVVKVPGLQKGLAVAAAYLVEQLRQVDTSVSVVSVEIDPVTGESDARNCDLVVFAVNADHLEAVVRRCQLDDRAATVAYWWWETDRMPPSYQRAASCVDEVWAPSSFVYSLLRAQLSCVVRRVPPPVPRLSMLQEIRSQTSRSIRQTLNISNSTLLTVTQADGNSSLWRKNTLAAMTAYRSAFAGTADQHHLLVKTRNLSASEGLAATIRSVCSQGDDITLIDEEWSYAEQLNILAEADIYLSLHRGEGFGLALIEALALGAQVVATDVGGATELAAWAAAHSVDYQTVHLEADEGPYLANSRWAEPDVGGAAEALMNCRRMSDDGVRSVRKLLEHDYERAIAGWRLLLSVRR